ncbi:unnamed protein product, partial [marine sediment metagenome]
IYADINLSGKLVENRKQGWKFLQNQSRQIPENI